MTREELKKEAEEYALNQWEGNLPWSVIQKAYYDGALPREKQIQIDAEQIRNLQKQNGELTDKLTLTNNECKDMREELKQRIRENQKLCEQIEKMKEIGSEMYVLICDKCESRNCAFCSVKEKWQMFKE